MNPTQKQKQKKKKTKVKHNCAIELCISPIEPSRVCTMTMAMKKQKKRKKKENKSIIFGLLDG